MIDIQSKEYDSAAKGWHVHAVADLKSGTRRGLHSVELAEDASDDDLKAAVLALYEPAKSK
jgi:hypothetical protein